MIATATLSRPPLPTADAISKESHKLGTPHVDRRVEIARSTRRPTFARRPLDVCSTVPRRGSDGQPKAAVLPRATPPPRPVTTATIPHVPPRRETFPQTETTPRRSASPRLCARHADRRCLGVGLGVASASPRRGREGSPSQHCYPGPPRRHRSCHPETAPVVRPVPATGNHPPRPTQGLGGALGHPLGCHLVGPLVLTWVPLGCRWGSLSQQCYPEAPRARMINTEATSPPRHARRTAERNFQLLPTAG